MLHMSEGAHDIVAKVFIGTAQMLTQEGQKSEVGRFASIPVCKLLQAVKDWPEIL